MRKLPKWVKVLGFVILADQATGFAVKYVKNKSFEHTRKEFPEYVNHIEGKYGDIGTPDLRFRFTGVNFGTVENGNVVLNSNTIIYLLRPANMLDGRSIAFHELGHLVAIKYSSEVKAELPKKKSDPMAFVHEGFAEYISRKEHSLSNMGYQKNFDFVKPVLDEYGIEKGIKLIVKNPTDAADIKNPQRYYKGLSLNLSS